MTRDPVPGREPDDEEPPEPPGRLRTTKAATLVGTGLVGLVVGWALRPVVLWTGGVVPAIGWSQVLALVLAAAVIGYAAWATHRIVHRRAGVLEPHQAVNRLVLAKSCALVGALVAGGYFGFALSHLGIVDVAAGRQRVVRGALAGAAGVAVVMVSLLLERACRVQRGDR